MVNKVKKSAGKIVVYTVLIITTFLILFPVVYIFLASFKTTQEIAAGGLKIIPDKFTFENYSRAWRAANFSRYTMNSIVYSGICTSVTIIFASMLGYCLQRKSFPGKKIILGSFFGSTFIAGAVTIYPVFKIIVNAGLHKSLAGLIIATIGGGSVTGTLLVIGYLKGVPLELDESATMDGAGLFTIYRKIILPMITPVLGVVALINFQGTWNNYLLPLALTLTKPNNRPLAVGVTSLAYSADSASVTKWDLLIAGSCMSIIPITIVYIFLNRYFVSGITTGAVKG